MVVPPGEYHDVIPESLLVYSNRDKDIATRSLAIAKISRA